MFSSWLLWGDDFGEGLWGETPFLSHCIESMSSTGFITIDVDLHHLGTGVFNFLAVLGLRFCKGFLSLQRVGSTPHRGAETSHCGDFSYGDEALGCTGFINCGIGIGFFTTELPGKSEGSVLETQLFRTRCSVTPSCIRAVLCEIESEPLASV